MKKLYIIPGWKETCRRKSYQLLAKAAAKKGYEIVFKNVNWKQKLSTQIFPIEKNSVIFGFSLGAVLARLIVQKYECKHVLLASMTPLSCFKDREVRKALIDILGLKFVNDVKKNLKPTHKAKKQTILYGDKEEEKADILVPTTGHEISGEYIKEIMGGDLGYRYTTLLGSYVIIFPCSKEPREDSIKYCFGYFYRRLLFLSQRLTLGST